MVSQILVFHEQLQKKSFDQIVKFESTLPVFEIGRIILLLLIVERYLLSFSLLYDLLKYLHLLG